MIASPSNTNIVTAIVTNRLFKLWHLRRLDIFSGLSDAEYGIIDPVYFIKKGRLKLVRTTPDGHEVILDILGPSTLFGELERGGNADEGP